LYYWKSKYGGLEASQLKRIKELEEGNGGEEFDCSLMENKIVLIGYLGPEKENMYLIPTGERKHSTWILANCVRNILDGHFDLAD
jgi:hypothetical protein